MRVKIFKTVFLAIILTIVALSFSGCAAFNSKGDKTESSEEATVSAEKLFNKGLKHNQNKNYTLAIETFETLESRYPFGPYAQQAQLEIAYANYKKGEPNAALTAIDQFLKLNPRHKHIDYAYYLQGLINFGLSSSFLDNFMERNAASMDVLPLQESFSYFRQLVVRFPDSRYAADAKQRMVYLRNLLASHELEVAQFYNKRGAYTAVADRAAYVIEHYQESDVVPEALAMLADAYDKLGLSEARKETLQVLDLNFPDYSK